MSTKFSELASLPNGAHFVGADLHVHSYGGSHDVKDATMTPEAIVDQAVADSLGILAITDHNATTNTQRSIDHALQTHPGRLLVLAAVEVSTAHGHLLVFFPPEGVAKLNSFVGQLNISEPGTADSHTSKSMADVATLADGLGGLCIAAHIDGPKGFEAADTGYPTWKRDIILQRAIVGLEFRDAANLHWYSDADEKSATGAERRKLLAQRQAATPTSGRAELARVQNSDAHSIAAFASAHQNRTVTRIKMDELTFESFRTAMCDPAARVRASVSVPKAIPRILGLHVDGGYLHGESFRLSDNLTCFIGGRGTGKSTAIKCIAHALGLSTDLDNFDNCPDSCVVWCRDADGVSYRYERLGGAETPTVQAFENNKVLPASVDSFHVEYYGQGELAKVAADPLAQARVLQQFLDRHIQLEDFNAREAELVAQLEQNSSVLRPLETEEATRPRKVSQLQDYNQKLQIAAAGQLQTIAARQTAIASERSLSGMLGSMADAYAQGLSLSAHMKDYAAAAAAAGTLTGDPRSDARLAAVASLLSDANAAMSTHQSELNALMSATAIAIRAEVAALDAVHATLAAEMAPQLAELQKAGLTASIAALNKLNSMRTQLAQELAKLDQKRPSLLEKRSERASLLTELESVRTQRAERRRQQATVINAQLAKTIDDYNVYLHYDQAGLAQQFEDLVLEHMHGTYFPADMARRFCAAITPQALAEHLKARAADELGAVAGIGKEWGTKLVEQLSQLAVIHELEVLEKAAAPRLKVMTKGSQPKQIPIKQLSDGQRHTILLTIAMLAESDFPLIIDQPEDDLDNAFIFTSIVRTLRDIKECRQVIVVTHNANIAVLGDAEMLFPMRQNGDRGTPHDVGSIDRAQTKAAVLRILEGGELAFLRRKEMYGH